MPNINAVLNDQIRRLARREIRSNTKSVKKATAHYRRDIAALKRQVSALTKIVKDLQRQEQKRSDQLPVPEKVEGLRFRADGLKTHRAKLGLSAKEYGELVGVSSLTIYNWEARKSKPRAGQLPKIAAVRGLGKREAMQRLGLGKADAPASDTVPTKTRSKGRRRSTFSQTAEEMILSLLKGRKSLTTSRINEAWRKEGRAGSADVTLGRMVKTRKLMRTKVKEGRGSLYRNA